MTPFGLLVREYRAKKQQTLASQAAVFGVSPAYLSALEHGKEANPSFALVDQICVFFDLIWDEAETIKLASSIISSKTCDKCLRFKSRRCSSCQYVGAKYRSSL